MKKRLFVLVCLLTVLILSHSCPAQTIWSKIIGWDLEEAGMSVRQTADGGYIVVGRTTSLGEEGNEILLVKTDGNGELQWIRDFGGEGQDIGESVYQTADGGYIIGGRTNSFGAGDWDAWIIKTDASGEEVWEQTVGDNGRNMLFDLQGTSDGGSIFIGTTQEGNDVQIWLVKTDATGNPQWERTFGNNGNESAFSVEQTMDGGYILIGNTSSIGAGLQDAWIIKTDASGAMQWNQTLGGSHIDQGASVHQTADGGFIITGSTSSYGLSNIDAWLVKTDGNGNEVWHRTFDGSLRDDGYAVQQTADGGYIFTGRTGAVGNRGGELWLVKTDADGTEQWNRKCGSAPSAGWDVKQTIDGGYVIAGATGQDLFLIKTDASGHSLFPEATARDPLALVTLQATNVVADAQLINVNTPLDIPENGKSGLWMYFFKSEIQQKLYEFWYQAGEIIQQDPLTVPAETVDLSMNPIPDDWIDSDEALAVAETNGGSAFRGAYADWRIGATLIPPGWAYPGTVWLVMYGSNSTSEGLVVVVDALLGTIYEMPTFTAREYLSKVDSTARDLITDAELIFVTSPLVNFEGEAEEWYFIYKSREQNAFYEFRIWGGLIKRSEPMTIMDDRISIETPVLPESWVDSDQALAVAEQNGGSEFMQTFNDYNIDVNLTTFECGESGCVRPTWQVFYTAPDTSICIRLDAVFGTTYDHLPRVTAREKLTDLEVVTDDTDIPADAQLVAVQSGMIDSLGESDRWSYIYESASQDSVYKFRVYGGQAEYHTRFARDQLQPYDTPLPEYWMDSDSAIAHAERDGGMDFRMTYPDWIIGMDIHAFVEGVGKRMALSGLRAIWNIYYENGSGPDGIHISVEALTYIPDYLKSTAREKLASVNDLAVNVAPDAQLVYINGEDLTVDGKSSSWIYIYQSADQQNLYEFWVLHNHVIQADQVTINNQDLYYGMPALPDRWADSDVVMAHAEQNGGSQFRENNQDWNVHSRLYTPLNEGPRWELFYDSSTEFQQINVDAFTRVESEPSNVDMPVSFQLFQNYPNPFNPETTIRYEVPRKDHIRLCIIDLLGQQVILLQDGEVDPGSYSAVWDGRDAKGKQMGSGIYLYVLKSSSFRQVKRMSLIR